MSDDAVDSKAFPRIVYLSANKMGTTSKRQRKLSTRYRLFDDKLPGEKQRVFWSSKENQLLLSVIERMQVVKALVRKRQKNADIFMAVEKKMKSEGSNKTWQQIRSRWKRMKSEYIRDKKIRGKRQLRKSSSPAADSASFDEMTRVLGKYADVIEYTSAYLGEEDGPPPLLDYDDDIDGEDAADGDIRVQVELLEGDAALEQSMTVEEESEIQVVKPEPLTPPSCSPSPSENPVPEERLKEITGKDKDQVTDGSRLSAKVPSSSAKVLAAEYARRHSLCHREWQEQYQQWYERQVEAQQQWEENFMREQMELTKSMLDNVTSTLLQGMQQVMQNVMGTVGRRTMTPFVPNFQMRNGVELNGLSVNHSDMFINPDAATNGSD